MLTKTAADIMNKKVITVPDNLPVSELANLFTLHSISGAPVLDEFGKLIGVVSLSDIVRTGADHETIAQIDPRYYAYDWDAALDAEELEDLRIKTDDGMTVADIMTPAVFGVSESMSISEMADTMIRGRIHRLIVMRNDRVVGIVSTLDMLRAVRDAEAPTPS